jgi:hypothetical protein
MKVLAHAPARSADWAAFGTVTPSAPRSSEQWACMSRPSSATARCGRIPYPCIGDITSRRIALCSSGAAQEVLQKAPVSGFFVAVLSSHRLSNDVFPALGPVLMFVHFISATRISRPINA